MSEGALQWFTPFHYIVYLGTILIVLIVYLQWKWARDCRENVQVIVARGDGSTLEKLVPKTGSSVSITNPNTNTTRLWPINELATIDLSYPGLGLVPLFMQKEMTTVILDEKDWEPMINRSPHRTSVVSPDVVKAIKSIAEECTDEKTSEILLSLVQNVRTSPSREMIASPAVLGNLMHEKITEAVITVTKDIMESVRGLTNRLVGLINPTIVYVCLGIIIVLLAVVLFQVMPEAEELRDVAVNVNKIKQSLGVQ